MKKEFLKILSKYQNIIHKVNLIYFKSSTDREDNFQEIVYQLWKSYPQLRNKESIGSWIYSVAINTSITKIKKVSKLDYKEIIPEIKDNFNENNEIEKNESIKLLLEAIHKLNDLDKSIILLYLEEKSYDEISNIIGISISNVGVRINRAKIQLKKILKNFEL